MNHVGKLLETGLTVGDVLAALQGRDAEAPLVLACDCPDVPGPSMQVMAVGFVGVVGVEELRASKFSSSGVVIDGDVSVGSVGTEISDEAVVVLQAKEG